MKIYGLELDQTINDSQNENSVVNKKFIDERLNFLGIKRSVKAATTANISLIGTQTIDGVVLSVGDRVLVKNQTSSINNGIYIVSSSNWQRASDLDQTPELVPGVSCYVEQGTTNGSQEFILTSIGPIVLGQTELIFVSRSSNIAPTTINISSDFTYNSGVLNLSSFNFEAGIYNNSTTSVTPFTIDVHGRITTIGNQVTITPSWNNIQSKPTTLLGYGITNALELKRTQITANYTVLLSDMYIGCRQTSSITIQLPQITTGNKLIYIKDELGNAQNYNINILPYSGDTVENTSNLIINSDFSCIALFYGSNNWAII